MSKKRNTRKRSTGWAFTKKYPHKNHPAYYRKRKINDEIEYITFTHSDKVDFDKDNKNKPESEHDIVETRKLHKPIKKGDEQDSYVVPRVYEGRRSALGKGNNELRIDKSDEPVVEDIFKNAPRQRVPYTNNSKKKPPKK